MVGRGIHEMMSVGLVLRLIRGKELDSVLVERIVTSFKHVRLHYEAGGRPFPFNGEPISRSQASCPSFL